MLMMSLGVLEDGKDGAGRGRYSSLSINSYQKVFHDICN